MNSEKINTHHFASIIINEVGRSRVCKQNLSAAFDVNLFSYCINRRAEETAEEKKRERNLNFNLSKWKGITCAWIFESQVAKKPELDFLRFFSLRRRMFRGAQQAPVSRTWGWKRWKALASRHHRLVKGKTHLIDEQTAPKEPLAREHTILRPNGGLHSGSQRGRSLCFAAHDYGL